MTQSCKSVGIMDTDTMLYSFNLECPPSRVIDRIDQQFDLFFPEKVHEEYKNRLTNGQLERYEDIRLEIDLYFSRKKKEGKLVGEAKYGYCLKYVKKFFYSIGKQKEFRSLGEGEKHCIALGLYLSRKMKTCIMVFSDDFRAVEAGINSFVSKTCLGSVRPLLEAMNFISCVSKDIKEVRMLTLVNEYFLLNEPKHTNMQKFRDEITKDIERSCRRRNHWRCDLPCLT